MRKCPYCAELIQDEAIICRFCGRDIKPLTAIRIYRIGVFYGMIRMMKVHVDGEVVGEVAFLKNITIPVAPGLREVRVSMDWVKSDIYEIRVKEGQILNLECGMPGGSIPQLKTFFAPNDVFFIKEYKP